MFEEKASQKEFDDLYRLQRENHFELLGFIHQILDIMGYEIIKNDKPKFVLKKKDTK